MCCTKVAEAEVALRLISQWLSLRCHLLLAVFGPLHLLQAVRLLRWLLVQNLLQLHLSSCAALGPVSSIASSVSVSVAGQIHTRIMFASSTGSCPEESEKCGDFSTEQFKGFRKRWAARPSGSPSDIFGDGLQSENLSSEHAETGVAAKRIKSDDADGLVSVVDSSVDELVEQPKLSASSSSRSHRLERDALLRTDISVFKYPWERVRLAKILWIGASCQNTSFEAEAGRTEPRASQLRRWHQWTNVCKGGCETTGCNILTDCEKGG